MTLILLLIGLMTMYNAKELALDGKNKREATERKKVLLELAREIKFESALLPLEFKFSAREPLRYYLWMCELEKWLRDNHKFSSFTLLYTFTPESIESTLIGVITHLLETKIKQDDTRKK